MNKADEVAGLSGQRPPADAASTEPPARPGRHLLGGRARGLGLVALLYLIVSVGIWWNVWSSHPSSAVTCGCGDGPLFVWFINWPAYAISHGLNPLFSTALFHPGGVNLLANTSEPAIGILLAPVTWLFGPVASLNVALTLSPVLSALAMYFLVRRWVSWSPAAFISGLVYGFSPLALTSLTADHLMIGLTAVPPLVVICLDELLIRQVRRPVRVGIALGILMLVQFFISTEVLVMMVVVGVLGVAVLIAYGALRAPDALRLKLRHGAVGLGAGVATSAVLLAYPAWFAIAGPAHFSGAIWRAWNLQAGGTSAGQFLSATPPSVVRSGLGVTSFGLAPRLGGYVGPILSPQFFGIGLLLVLVAGLVFWWHDLKLWFFSAMALVSLVLSLGAPHNGSLPWNLFVHFPEFENVIPSRFVLFAYLAVGVQLGLILDHTYRVVAQRLQGRGDHGSVPPRASRQRIRWSLGPTLAAALVAIVALGQPVAYLGQNVPIRTEALATPAWFQTMTAHAAPRQVVLVLPAPFSARQASMAWQSLGGTPYDLIGGGGPGALFAESKSVQPGAALLGQVSLIYGYGPSITPEGITAVRRAIDHWGVTKIVIPADPDLPPYARVSSVPLAVALITAATGRAPELESGAWVWAGVNHSGPPVAISKPGFSACTSGIPQDGLGATRRAASCVLSAAP